MRPARCAQPRRAIVIRIGDDYSQIRERLDAQGCATDQQGAGMVPASTILFSPDCAVDGTVASAPCVAVAVLSTKFWVRHELLHPPKPRRTD